MAPIAVQIATPDSACSHLIPSRRGRYHIPFHAASFPHVTWIAEEFDPNEAQLGQSPRDESVERLWPDCHLPEASVPQRKLKHGKRRGGGGLSSPGGSSRSSANYKAPAPASAPVSAPQPPKSAAPAQKPAPVPAPNPKSVSASPKPKAAARPALMSGKNPRIGKPASIPKQQQVPGYRPYAESTPSLSSVQHQPTGRSSKGFTPHSEPSKLDRCNIKCRDALLGTFGAIAILGLLCLLIRCIVLRNRSNAEEKENKAKRRAGKAPDRRWWREGDNSPSVLEEGLELTTPQQHIERSHFVEVARPRLQRQPTPMPRRRISSSVSYEEPPSSRLGLSNNSSFVSTSTYETAQSTTSCPAVMTTRATSPCSSRFSERSQIHYQSQNSSTSGVRKPLSIDSDDSNSDHEDPVRRTAQQSVLFPTPPPISTIVGMQGFQASHCQLQRRGARRNSDRADMSESRHRSLSSESDGILVNENASDKDEMKDDDGTRTVTDLGEWSRGRSIHRSLRGSARKRREEIKEKSSGVKLLKHAESGIGGSEQPMEARTDTLVA